MNYVKGKPYFLDIDCKINQYEYLSDNIATEVVVVGGGINGAITLYNLAKRNIPCVLIDKGRIGYGNTSCATALLEYQLDDYCDELSNILTQDDIISVYKLGLDSLNKIEDFVNEYGNDCEYVRRDTLIYTDTACGVKDIAREYEIRKQNNLDVQLYTCSNSPFSFDIKAGLYAKDGGGDFNPYLFTSQLVKAAVNMGAKVYEHTEVKDVLYFNDSVKLVLDYGVEINANKVICATGYNTKVFTNKKLCTKYISYTIVTQPLENFGWYNSALIQDTSSPYHYMKITKDNRIVLGGEDVLFWREAINKKTAKDKYFLLEEHLYKLFPQLEDKINIDYKFCGAFASTVDNLSVIGVSEENKNLWYCLGYGANGIVNAIQGGDMLAKLYSGEIDKNLKYFSPARF